MGLLLRWIHGVWTGNGFASSQVPIPRLNRVSGVRIGLCVRHRVALLIAALDPIRRSRRCGRVDSRRMPARELPAAKIDRLLAARDANAALQVADELLAKLPSSPVGHLGRTRALLAIGRPLEAHRALDRALAVAPNDPVANTILANIDAQAGRDTEAIERLRPLALASSAQANEALLVLLDILYHSNRRDEWRALLDRPGPWRQDPRALIHRARLVAVDDASAGVEGLIALFRGNAPLPQRRLAGFEAVALLDRAGNYRRAFDLAT